VVLATGGACWLYYPHTNTSCSSTGDGYALALDAGAELIDMEQVQFGAFGLTHPESMTGQGLADPYYVGPLGRLLNKGGEVILENFSRMTRDQATRVVAEEIHKAGGSQSGGLTLDLSPNLQSEEGRKMIAVMKGTGIYDHVRWAYGEDAYNLKEPWDIAPFAHYMMGGIRVDTFGETSVRGLFAAGEVQGGIHGANRLGSVALADIFVFGKRAGENAAYGALHSNISGKFIPEKAEAKVKEFAKLIGAKGNWRPIKLQRELQETMWKKVGVIRFQKQLKESIQEIDDIGKKSCDVNIPSLIRYNRDVVDAIELGFMQATAKAIALSALLRKETRGAHIRLDYPNKESVIKHTISYMEDDQIKVRVLSIN
jgi:succinate dehydrogenase/fumarate reductase flavoprotein subunit